MVKMVAMAKGTIPLTIQIYVCFFIVAIIVCYLKTFIAGDDPDQLKEEAELSMADLIARFVKPKKGSPFLHKKAGRKEGGSSTSKLANDTNGVVESPVTTGRKRAFCDSGAGSSATKCENGTNGEQSSEPEGVCFFNHILI